MHLLSSFNLDPKVSTFEQYLKDLNSIDFDILFTIANSDLLELSEQDFVDLTILAVNIYSSEMEIDSNNVHSNSDMVFLILKRFLSTILIHSLIDKGLIEKSENEDMTLYKDCSFKPTEIGQLVNNWKNSSLL